MKSKELTGQLWEKWGPRLLQPLSLPSSAHDFHLTVQYGSPQPPHIHPRPGMHRLTAKSNSPPALVNWNIAIPICLPIVCSCFWSSTVELSSCNKEDITTELEILSCPLQNKVTNSYYRQRKGQIRSHQFRPFPKNHTGCFCLYPIARI